MMAWKVLEALMAQDAQIYGALGMVLGGMLFFGFCLPFTAVALPSPDIHKYVGMAVLGATLASFVALAGLARDSRALSSAARGFAFGFALQLPVLVLSSFFSTGML